MRPMSNDKEYRLVLSPLRNAINAEDTVAKMLKKKYSFLLFMKDRSIKRWGEDLLRDAPNKYFHKKCKCIHTTYNLQLTCLFTCLTTLTVTGYLRVRSTMFDRVVWLSQ